MVQFQVQNVVLHKLYLGYYAKRPLLGKHSFGYYFTSNQLRDLKSGLFSSVSVQNVWFYIKFSLVAMQKKTVARETFF